jgi:hypothetical protein
MVGVLYLIPMTHTKQSDTVSLSFFKMITGLGSNIGHGLFVDWVEHPDIFCWVSFLYPTYLPVIFVLSAKPNKIDEDRTIP